MPDGYFRTLKASKYTSFIFCAAFSLYVDLKGIRLTCQCEHFSTVEYTGVPVTIAPLPLSKNMRREGWQREAGKLQREGMHGVESDGQSVLSHANPGRLRS